MGSGFQIAHYRSEELPQHVTGAAVATATDQIAGAKVVPCWFQNIPKNRDTRPFVKGYFRDFSLKIEIYRCNNSEHDK